MPSCSVPARRWPSRFRWTSFTRWSPRCWPPGFLAPGNRRGSQAWRPCAAHSQCPHRAERTVHIVEGGLDDPRVVALLHTHVTRARAETARGSAHALDLSGLRAPEIAFWTAWEGEDVVGVGALKRLSAEHG